MAKSAVGKMLSDKWEQAENGAMKWKAGADPFDNEDNINTRIRQIRYDHSILRKNGHAPDSEAFQLGRGEIAKLKEKLKGLKLKPKEEDHGKG